MIEWLVKKMIKISASKVRCYKACKRAYYFRYVENLVPVESAQPLVDGRNYHAMLEHMYNDGEFEVDIENNPKISAMAKAYEKYIYPKFYVKNAEQEFEYNLNEDVQLVGRFDGIAEDGLVVEHKTTSADVDDEYVYNLQWDEQILTYMLASGKNEMYYTVCKKPTIRQKQNESAEEYYDRCCAWYDEDTDKKIRVIKVTRSEKEVQEHKAALEYVAAEIGYDDNVRKYKLYNYRDSIVYYRNCSNCTAYGRKCEYASICLDYDPKLEYVEFKKKEKE